MTALTQAVAEGDTTLYIDTAFAEGSFPGYIKIDSELLQVGGVEHRNPLLLTLSKPAEEAHDNGATVTYAGNPFSSTFRSASTVAGEQTIRLLGPYNFTYDTPGLDTGIEVAQLDAGTLVVAAWIEVVETWDANPDTAFVSIDAAGYPVAQGLIGDNEADTANAFRAPAAYWNLNHNTDSALHGVPWFTRPVRVIQSRALTVGAYNTDGATQGEANAYALIAEPSA